MAESEQSNNEIRSSKGSGFDIDIPLITKLIKVVLKLLSITILAGFVSILIEFICYFFVDDPINAAYDRYRSVSSFITGNWLNEESVIETVEYKLTNLINFETTRSIVQQYSSLFATAVDENLVEMFFKPYLVNGINHIPRLFDLWLIVTFTWMAKVVSIVALVPPCIIILLSGFVDGSVQRKINTYKGKRDSQDKIEWWFLAFKFSSYSILFLYVALPNPFTAPSVLFPCSVISAICLRNVVTNYKKYW